MTKTKSYELSMRNINASISLLYNLVRSKPFDLYTGLGYTMHFTKYGSNKMTTTYSDNREADVEDPFRIEYQKGWGIINAKIGTRFAERFDVCLHYSIGGSFSNVTALRVDPNQLLFQVNYQF